MPLITLRKDLYKMKRFPYLLHGITFILLLFIDQITKHIVRLHLKAEPISVIKDIFSFHYLENRGSVWGILQGKVDILLVVSVILLAIMIYVYIKMPKRKEYFPLFWIIVFMVAGAVGNTIDRLVFGYVTDFLYFELIDFPIFNIADCYITVCAFLTIILILTKYKDDEFQFLSLRRKEMTDAESKSDEI